MGYSPWGCNKSGRTEVTWQQCMAVETATLGLNPHLLTLGKALHLCVPVELIDEGPNGVSSSLGPCRGDSAAGWLWPWACAGA